MAKKSPAKVKMLAAQAKRVAATRREEKNIQNQPTAKNDDSDLARYESLDSAWRELGLSVPVRKALIDDELIELSDLRKTSLAAVKELPGMSHNAIRVLIAEMKKADLTFRK